MLSAPLRIVYLHGFASSPESRKAHFFCEKLQQLGFVVDVPDLAEGDFERLTISAQLRVIERTSGHKPIIIIGSSLGGYLAALYAARHPEVDRLVLLAPAFDFHRRWITQLGPERLAAWRGTGVIRVFHYAAGCELPQGTSSLKMPATLSLFLTFVSQLLSFTGTMIRLYPLYIHWTSSKVTGTPGLYGLSRS